MTKYLTGLAVAVIAAVGLTATPALAAKAKVPGSLTVYDDAKMFTADGVEKAKTAFRSTSFDHGLTVTVDTYAEPPEEKKAAAEAARGDQGKWRAFMESWAKERAQGDKAKGVYVLVLHHPGGVAVIADRETRERGFTDADEAKVRDTLIGAFREAKGKPDATQVQDGGLKAAVDFIASDLKDTTVATATTANARNAGGGGMSVGGWVCLGLCVLLGAWLVIGLIRAFTGGGGGGGGGPGGGGGGFATSLFGGLFGAMAGMWLYNNMFGGGMFGGSDAYAGDGAGDAGGDTGAGDYGGESGAAGGYDDGGGGGGGDWGGGGDFGGGGGDFGGGDF